MNTQPPFKLGDMVKDKISGFTGRATAREYRIGIDTPRVAVQPPTADSKLPAEEWFPEPLLEKVNDYPEIGFHTQRESE